MKEDLIALAKLRLEELLTFFGVNTKVKVEEEGNTIELTVDTDAGGRLIGYRGETLRSIQHLINMMVKNAAIEQGTERFYISVDIVGYKKARAETITAKVQEYAAKVVETGREKQLGPMNAHERRIVHMALAANPDVVTDSVGLDPRRRVVIRKRTD